MSRLDVFVPPRPSNWLIRAMTPVNRAFMLKGFAGLRGVCDIRTIDFPESEQRKLAAVCGEGKATFITPNHPEFFTDWMLDKEISARVSPRAAFWATNRVVNGLGRLAQKFWLANNLIAQIPGNSEPAREHSVDWALKGNVVLLHPEGAVGWHGNYVAPLMPGAVEMALEALKLGRAADPGFHAFVAPVVWKLVFDRDVEADLLKECVYVEGRLGIEPGEGLPLPERVYRLYETLLERDEADLGIEATRDASFPERHGLLVKVICKRLAGLLAIDRQPAEALELLRIARRRLREAKTDPAAPQIKSAIDRLALNLRLGDFAFSGETVTQEELAEHIKRIRNDYCKGTMRDTVNRYVPRPAGPRTAIIRVPEAIAMHRFEGNEQVALAVLGAGMQAALDRINVSLAEEGRLRTYPNPFCDRRLDAGRALLRSVLVFDRPVAELEAALLKMGWGGQEIVTLTPRHVVEVLERYLAGQIDAETIAAWAELIEMRDDIAMPYQGAVDAIFFLANPLINGALDVEAANKLIAELSA